MVPNISITAQAASGWTAGKKTKTPKAAAITEANPSKTIHVVANFHQGSSGDDESVPESKDSSKPTPAPTSKVEGDITIQLVKVTFVDLFMSVGYLGTDPPCVQDGNLIKLHGQGQLDGSVSVTPQSAVKSVGLRLVQTVNAYGEGTYTKPVPGKTKNVWTTIGKYLGDGVKEIKPGDESNISQDNIRVRFQDEPYYGYTNAVLLLNSVSMNYQFNVYMQYKLKADSEWKTVGLCDWSVTGSCQSSPSSVWTGGTKVPATVNGKASKVIPSLTPTVKMVMDQGADQ